MKRNCLLFVLVLAGGCSSDYVSAPALDVVREPAIGELDVAPSGALWALEPLDRSSLAIRRYEGDDPMDTVPVPMEALTSAMRNGSTRAALVALDDRVFVGAVDPLTPGLTALWQWDGAAWTDVMATIGPASRASRPVRDAAGATWIAVGARVARIDADGTWTVVSLPSALDTVGIAAPLSDGVRVLAFDSFDRARVVDVASDASATVIATLERDPRTFHAIGAIGDRPVLVTEDEYRQELLDLEGDIVDALIPQAEFFDARTADDGALWILAREHTYQRFLAVRFDDEGAEYAGAIEDEGTAYYPATHLAADGSNGVFVYGAGIYHAMPSNP